MQTCKNCRFWKYYTDTAYNGRIISFWYECDCPKDDTTNDGAEVYAEALDDSGLTYGFRTGPNFGCVNFEKKEG